MSSDDAKKVSVTEHHVASVAVCFQIIAQVIPNTRLPIEFDAGVTAN